MKVPADLAIRDRLARPAPDRRRPRGPDRAGHRPRPAPPPALRPGPVRGQPGPRWPTTRACGSGCGSADEPGRRPVGVRLGRPATRASRPRPGSSPSTPGSRSSATRRWRRRCPTPAAAGRRAAGGRGHGQPRRVPAAAVPRRRAGRRWRRPSTAWPGVTAAFVDDATPASVLDALSAGADVFHFTRPRARPTAGVVLAGAGGQAEVVPADRLAEMVQAKGVRLAVLGACDTGRRDDHNVWGGVAAALVRAGRARGGGHAVHHRRPAGGRLRRRPLPGPGGGAHRRRGRRPRPHRHPRRVHRRPAPTSATGASPSSTCGTTAGGCSSRCRRPRPGRRRRPASTRLYQQRVGTVSAGGLVLGAVLGAGSVEAVEIEQEADTGRRDWWSAPSGAARAASTSTQDVDGGRPRGARSSAAADSAEALARGVGAAPGPDAAEGRRLTVRSVGRR